MFGNLPVELLTETIGYIHQPSHLQALCLVSKTVSSVATKFLYRDLALDIPLDNDAFEEKLDVFEAVSMCDGLKFVKTLKVVPIKDRMVTVFDRLISRLRDHFLVDFEWDALEPPLDSQLLYIWNHQRNIQSIDLANITDTVKAVQPWDGLRFPQKYVHISLKLRLKKCFLENIDFSRMRALTIRYSAENKIPTCISANWIHITNLQLHSIFFFHLDLELDRLASLVSLGLYCCMDTDVLLSNFKDPKLKDFHIEYEWDYFEPAMPNEDYEWTFYKDLVSQFSFIRRFQGLETLVIEVPDRRHSASLLNDLVDAISLGHNNTLRRLALLDACLPVDGSTYTFDTIESRNSVYNAIMACPHLVQLELPTAWHTKEWDFKRIIDNLPSLEILCLRLHVPWDRLPWSFYEQRLPFAIAASWVIETSISQVATSLICSITGNSSKLRLLGFETRGYEPRQCYTRGWSHSTHLESHVPPRICEKFVKYHIPEYELMRDSAHPSSWQAYCDAKRYVHEELKRRNNKSD